MQTKLTPIVAVVATGCGDFVVEPAPPLQPADSLDARPDDRSTRFVRDSA
jgi:hypothetical protein